MNLLWMETKEGDQWSPFKIMNPHRPQGSNPESLFSLVMGALQCSGSVLKGEEKPDGNQIVHLCSEIF